MNNIDKITMSRSAGGTVVIDIEGVIGVSEEWQFDPDDTRVATYNKFRMAVDSIRAIRAETVKVNIRSQGGSVEDALLIYEALCSLEAPVETVCHGYVASAATIIAQAGDIRRVSTGTLYLVHRATMVVEGNSQEILHASTLLGKTDERIAQIYADRSGLSVDEFRELMSRDAGRGEWLTPEEVVRAGLADEVINMSYISRFGKKIKELISPATNPEEQVQNATRELFTMPELQKKATATQTIAKEDPNIGIATTKESANQRAYNQDVAAFKSSLF